jgi:UDP-N-acetylmuramoylalanine--D-glutamate ligase
MPISPLREKFLSANKVYILGAGPSGRRLVSYCLRQGKQVFCSDLDTKHGVALNDDFWGQEKFQSYLGEHPAEFLQQAEMVVRSPGLPPTADILRKARSFKKPVCSGIELAAAMSDAKMVIVTGSVGKSTFVKLLELSRFLPEEQIFVTDRDAGINLVELLSADQTQRLVVAELSVAELDGVEWLCPELIIVTNLLRQTEHIQDYNDYAKYLQAKFGWFKKTEQQASLVIAVDSWQQNPELQRELLFEVDGLKIDLIAFDSNRPEYLLATAGKIGQLMQLQDLPGQVGACFDRLLGNHAFLSEIDEGFLDDRLRAKPYLGL